MEEGGDGHQEKKKNRGWWVLLRRRWQAKYKEILKHRGERGRNETGQARTRERKMRKTSEYELETPGRRIPAAIFFPSSSFLRLVLPPQGK